MRKHYTPIGNIFKSYQLVWTNVENISGLMKSYQSMWNACTYPMRKHSTPIGNFSKLPNFPKIWASIPHQLVTFEMLPIDVECLRTGYAQAFHIDW